MNVKKNDIVQVEIEDLGESGEGIGKLDGYTLFIKDAVIGDVVEAKIMKAKKHYAYARLERVVTPSPFRVEPKCRFHRQCGGCQIQALSYEKQLEFKQNKVKNNLIRIGGLDPKRVEELMEAPVGMEQPFFYRNKAQFPFGRDKEGKTVTGFYAGRTHSIIANTDCALGVKENQLILEKILKFMEEEKILPYDEEKHRGLVRHVLIRKGFSTGQLMVCLVLNGTSLPRGDRLVQSLAEIPGMASISISINREKTNVIMGKEIQLLYGKEQIEDTIGGLTFRISPLSFYQVNPVQTEKIYQRALEYAALTGEETVWDLYCGIGTISLFLARKAGQVYGVEIIPEAIQDAKENARINGIENVEFFVGKAEEVLPSQYEQEGIYADVIVVDPPRKGCDEACLSTMVKMHPERIVYVSCDSATLARDVKYLEENGYRLKKAGIFDNFAQGVHMETVALLSLKTNQPKLEVTMEVNTDSNYIPDEKVTYQKIRDYIIEKHGLKVSTLCIAQIKDKCGLKKQWQYQATEEGKAKVPQCTQKREKAIMDAFEYYGLI